VNANGLWLLPSRGRVNVLWRYVNEAVNTGLSTPGIILVQHDEVSDYGRLELPDGWRLVSTQSQQMGDKIREASGLYMKLDWVGILTDDLVPETHGWDRILVEEAVGGRHIASCADGTNQMPRRMGAAVWPGELLRAVGYLHPRGFNHLYFDDVWEMLGRATGCWKERLDVMVRHLHPFLTGVEDDTHRTTYSDANWIHDRQAFEDWKLYVRPNSVRAIKQYLTSSGAGDKAVLGPPSAQPDPMTAGSY